MTEPIKGAVAEAYKYPCMLCNQRCKTHIYIKDGKPYDQSTGLKHDCYMARIAKMFMGYYRMVKIDEVISANNVGGIMGALENAEEFCRKWRIAFDNWKKDGRVPSSEEVARY